MAQLDFAYNIEAAIGRLSVINNGTLSFFPFNIYDSISFGVLNFLIAGSNVNRTVTFSVGLYSLTISTISLINSISGTITQNNASTYYVNLTDISSTQNITPGTWWFGFLASTAGNANVSLLGNTIAPGNAFPGAFIGGNMTDSTNALPSSYATSNLNITGSDAMNVPMIIITA